MLLVVLLKFLGERAGGEVGLDVVFFSLPFLCNGDLSCCTGGLSGSGLPGVFFDRFLFFIPLSRDLEAEEDGEDGPAFLLNLLLLLGDGDFF